MKTDSSEEKIKRPAGMENVTEKGTVKLNDNVLSSIVKIAACEVPGVIRIATGGNIFENVAYLIGHDKTRERVIKVEMSGEKAAITISIIVSYGKNIPQLANEVQLNIIQKIKEFTGLEISKVDVIINGIEESNKEE